MSDTQRAPAILTRPLDAIDPARTALVLVDMQNDFLDPAGAYARGGAGAPAIAALAPRLAPFVAACREAGVCIVSTRFTLWPGPAGEPMIAEHLARLRPFLRRGDFAAGSWGQALIDALAPADFAVDKVAYSAFYCTQLDWVLKRRGIDTLLMAGIVTNGGVASTARDAHVRDYHVVVLSDACAAFRQEVHDASIADLASIGTVTTLAAASAALPAPA